MTTTIVKWGNSRGIRLPKPFLESLNLKDNDEVSITTNDGAIIIKKLPRSKSGTLRQQIEEFYGMDFEAAIKEHASDFQELGWGVSAEIGGIR